MAIWAPNPVYLCHSVIYYALQNIYRFSGRIRCKFSSNSMELLMMSNVIQLDKFFIKTTYVISNEMLEE